VTYNIELGHIMAIATAGYSNAGTFRTTARWDLFLLLKVICSGTY
jgi:hypothetical protein